MSLFDTPKSVARRAAEDSLKMSIQSYSNIGIGGGVLTAAITDRAEEFFQFIMKKDAEAPEKDYNKGATWTATIDKKEDAND